MIALQRILLVAACSLPVSACTIGQRVTAPVPATSSAQVPAQIAAMRAGFGYIQFQAQAQLNNSQAEACRNLVSRFYERRQASTILVSLDGRVHQPVMTKGVDDTANSCNPASNQAQLLGPRLHVPTEAQTIVVSVRAINSQDDNVNVGQVIRDFATVATVAGIAVGAGPTSGLLVAASAAAQMNQALGEDARVAIRNTTTQNRDGPILRLEQLRGNPVLVSMVHASDDARTEVGQVSIQINYIDSLFAGMRGSTVVDGRTHFATVFPVAIRTHAFDIASTGPNRSTTVDQLLLEDSPDFITRTLRAVALIGPNDTSDLAKSVVQDACDILQRFVEKRGFTFEDAYRIKWAYLSPYGQVWNTNVLPGTGSCISTEEAQYMRRDGLVPPAGSLLPAVRS